VRSVAPKDATIDHMLDHLDHVVKLVGHEHVGLGLDFVEGYQERHRAGNEPPSVHDRPPKWRTLRPDIFGTAEDFYNIPYPKGLHSTRLLPNFTQGLLERGYSADQVEAILGRNWLSHFERAVG
jgi:membrane dipeptidase